MKNKLKIILAFLFLVSCASSGVKIDPKKVSEFQKGKTTYSEVIDALGSPTQVMTLDDGRKIITYSYYGVQSRPENFIPYVGAFVGGHDMEASTVSMVFNKKELLQSVTSSQTGMGTGHNLEAISQSRKEVREVK
ncbi:MAG: hypothetical protein K2Q32_09635 [Alphaproteobacteria bacterium]|nr:hypothetical protein [Alphaproteobacteria bacterium]